MSKKPIIILGAGGHAKVIVEVLRQSNRRLLGLIAPDLEKGSSQFGLKVLGNDSDLDTYSVNDVELANGVGAIPGSNRRRVLASKVRSNGFIFSSVIHPTAIIADDVELDEGVQIMAGAIIQSGAKISRDAILNTGVIIDHDCLIGRSCHIAPGVILSGSVCVGENTHIGTGTSVIQNINVGSNVIIAAGSVLYHDVQTGKIFIQRK